MSEKVLRNEVVTVAAATPEDDICGICLSTFNKSTRAKSTCPYCRTGICRGCLQTYLLNDISDVPPCVNTDCKHAWEREFLDEQFTRAFRLSTYKEHREKVLADREKARLPATQDDAAAYKVAHSIYIERDKEVKELELQMRTLQQLLWRKERERHVARETVDTYGRRRPGVAGATGGAGGSATEEKSKPAAFIKPCPAPDCRGFLSTAWKCGLCSLWSCPDCHELKGEARDAEHTCDATKVATVRMLEKEAKSCPKCGALICKISGCDQMWCTNCNTAFNWKTGTVAHGPIHNPHYFQWLQAQQQAGGGAAGGGVGVGGFPGPCAVNWETDRAIARTLDVGVGHRYGRTSKQVDGSDLKDKLYLAEAWRLMREMQDVRDHDPDMEEKFRQLRVQYMCGEINEDDWKTRLQRLEKDVNFNRSIRQVRETFTGVAQDLIRQVLTTSGTANPSIAAERIAEIRAQVEKLVIYCNECYENITKRFGRKTPIISFRVM